MKSPVNSHNDWDPLEEVIVGSIRGGVVPRMDPSFYTFHGPFDEGDEHHIGPIPESIVEETEEDIDEFVKVLTSFGVNVRRPSFVDHSTMISTPYWENEGQFSLMPRDCLIVIGDEILETPMMCRSRQCETLGFKDLLIEYFKTGAKWAASPKPRLLDSGYDIPNKTALPELNNLEPIFDAANILRCGRDLFFNVNMSGNRLGLNWLQSHLGREYRIHEVSVSRDHIDTTLIPLGPGRILINPEYVKQDEIPDLFKSWDVYFAPDNPPELSYGLSYEYCSNWIGLNLFAINPDTVIVQDDQIELIRLLEKKLKLNVIPLRCRHSRTFGGGWHCITLDVRRSGTLEDYF